MHLIYRFQYTQFFLVFKGLFCGKMAVYLLKRFWRAQIAKLILIYPIIYNILVIYQVSYTVQLLICTCLITRVNIWPDSYTDIARILCWHYWRVNKQTKPCFIYLFIKWFELTLCSAESFRTIFRHIYIIMENMQIL